MQINGQDISYAGFRPNRVTIDFNNIANVGAPVVMDFCDAFFC